MRMDSSTINYYSNNAKSVADRYESVVNSLSDQFGAAFHLHSKILDIGCGSGRDLAVLHAMGHRCYGIDSTPEFVTIATEIHPELKGHIVQAALPLFDVPFGGGFDGALCSAVLMHLEVNELATAAESIKKCLSRSGRLLYSVPSRRGDVKADNRDANGRLFVPNQAGRLHTIFEQLGFRLISKWNNADSMGRDAIEWESVLMELT